MNRASAGRVRLRLHTNDRHTQTVQARCSRWFHARLQHELADVLTRVAVAQNGDCIIVQLTVKLGDIPLSRFENVMSERIIIRLKQALQACRWYRDADGILWGSVMAPPEMGAASGSGRGGVPLNRSATEPLISGRTVLAGQRTYLSPVSVIDPSTGVYSRMSASHTTDTGRRLQAQPGADNAVETNAPSRRPSARFSQLLRYLDTGIVVDARPWLRRISREAWLMETLEQAAEPVEGMSPQAALALRVLQPRAWQRLVSAWSGEALISLSRWLTASASLPSPPVADVLHYLPLAALLALNEYTHAVDPINRSSSPPGIARVMRHAGSGAELTLTNRDAHGGLPSLSGESLLNSWLDVLLRTLPEAARNALQGRPFSLKELPVRVLQQLSQEYNKSVLQRTPQVSPPEKSPLTGLERFTPFPEKRASKEAQSSARPTAKATAIGSKTSDKPADKASDAGDKPSSEVTKPGKDEVWVISNAGLVLLWPLLSPLFSTFGWVKDGGFVDETARWQALSALDWLAWGETDLAEWRAPCARLLCGIDMDLPFAAEPVLPEQQAELDVWLEQVFQSLPLIGRCELRTLRELFLQRAGTLETENRLRITVEPHAGDVLLYDLPWPLTPIILPWGDTPISVEWK